MKEEMLMKEIYTAPVSAPYWPASWETDIDGVSTPEIGFGDENG